MAAATKTRDMTTGSPLGHIIAFTIPVFMSVLFQQFYSIADSMIVGKLMGSDALAAVGCTHNIYYLISGLCMGTTSGFAIPVSQYFGGKDDKNMRKSVGNSVGLSILFALVFTIPTCIFARQLLVFMHTPSEILTEATSYLFIVFLGIPATILYNLLAAFLRALGNSRVPLIFIVISSVINIGLDVLFIAVFHMGVSGAAWATVLSQALSGVACLIYIVRDFEPLHIKKADLAWDGRIVKKLLGAGLPMGLQFSITSIGGAILQAAINGLGTAYITTFSVCGRMEGFFGCVFNSLGSTMATYCGQNIGAKKYDRLKKGIVLALIISWAYCICVFVLMNFFGRAVALLFVTKEDVEIIGYIETYLKILTGFFLCLSFINVVRPAIQGMGYASAAMFAGLFELVGRGAAGLFLIPRFGFMGACFAAPLAWVLADAYLVAVVVYIAKKLRKA